jgi:Cof subfamily protein (haloacid dehalogenase superfamily)
LIRLAGIDVDGTLVGTGGAVHPSIWTAAAAARAAGIHLVLCSGRPAFGHALDYAQQLNAAGWHVFQNGASIMDLGSGTSRSSQLPQQVIDEFVMQARRTGDLLELYSDHAYASESDSPWAHEHAVLLGVPFARRSFESLESPVVRAQWILPAPQATTFAATARPGLEIALSTSPVMEDATFVGITPAGVSKGSALESVAQAYGIAMSDVMYVGDADNDLSALRRVGHPVAMANASPSVLGMAKHVVGHVDAGGLAQALHLAISATAASCG